MDTYAKMVEKIIIAQEEIIGPVALEQAGKVSGLTVDWQKREIKFEGSKKDIIEKLVEKYKSLFGPASVEMCKDAVRAIASNMKTDELPESLR
jgi:hypothetical protein